MQTGVCSPFYFGHKCPVFAILLRASRKIRYFQFTEEGTVNSEQ